MLLVLKNFQENSLDILSALYSIYIYEVPLSFRGFITYMNVIESGRLLSVTLAMHVCVFCVVCLVVNPWYPTQNVVVEHIKSGWLADCGTLQCTPTVVGREKRTHFNNIYIMHVTKEPSIRRRSQINSENKIR